MLTNTIKNRKTLSKMISSLAMVGIPALLLFMAPVARTQETGNNIVIIGEVSTPVLKKVVGNRKPITIDKAKVKTLLLALEESEDDEEDARDSVIEELKELMTDVDAVVVDMSNFTIDEDAERLIDVAEEIGVPVIMENVKAELMAQLTGAGVTADLVVMETRDDGEMNFSIWDDGLDKIVEGEEESIQENLLDHPDLTPEEKKKLKAQIKAGELQTESVDKKPSSKDLAEAEKYKRGLKDDGYELVTKEVENILRDRPFSKGAKDLAITSSGCAASTACREGKTVFSPHYWCPNGHCQNSVLAPQFSWGMYAGSGQKWIILQSEGSIGPGTMKWNKSSDKGYFLEKFVVEFKVNSLPSGWVLDRTSPKNANNTGKLASTTGISFDAGFTGSSPQATVGYKESKTSFETLTDWKVTNHIQPPSAKWTFALSKAGGQTYNSWQDIFTRNWCCVSVGSLPGISTAGTQPRTEAVWRGRADSKDSVGVTIKWTMDVRNTWFTTSWFTVSKQTRPASRTRNPVWSVFDMAEVY